MKPEDYIKKMQAKDYQETCVLLESLPEFIEKERHKSKVFYFLLIDRFSGEWSIRYEEVKDDDFREAPECLINVSDISLLCALREVHKKLKALKEDEK